ncbi:hypothetical protein [Pseudomonas fluvialis]|uniref:hypothetical protein n=1 Tax=Pseudomonas fluvialis TaxID=1793966 RepID=UPI0035AE1CA9
MREVKRYDAVHLRYEDSNIRYGEGCEVEVVTASDYAALEAECANLKNSLLAITARHFAESWKKRTNDAELEQYLSAGIAQLEAERAALAAELAAIKGQEPVAFYWQDIGYPEPRKHGPYFGWPSESALRNVDGGAIPVPLYALPHAPRAQEGT